MTTLSIFQPEITTLETQLTALQTQLEELRQAEQTAAQLLATLADSLPRFEKLGAIARIKTAVLGLFGETDAPKLENLMTAAEPTTEEIFAAEVLPHPAPEPKQLTIEGAIAEASQPTAEPAPSIEPAAAPAEQVSQYIEQIFLTRTVAYQKKHTGEIVCAYIGLNTQKLAQNWAECVQLWGCDAEVRKAKRMSAADIRWEVKIKKISKAQLDQIAANHTSPFQSVPAASGSRLPEEKKPESQPNPSLPNGGATSDASNAAKPQVSLVLGKADNIYTTYHVYLEGKEIGRVERMSATTNSWTVPRLPGDWESAEAAADALIAKREADRKLHQDTNDLLRARYGLPV